MSVPPKILELLDLFHRNAAAYHAPQYNEAMVRQEFINPLFKCLGWDMDNEQGYAEAYKDVIHEAAIKIGGPSQSARILLSHWRCGQVLSRSQKAIGLHQGRSGRLSVRPHCLD